MSGSNKKMILIILGLILILVVAGLIGAEWHTSKPEFCGNCHIMKKYYNQWAKDKHAAKNIGCVDCHYAPGTKMSPKAKFKGLGQLFTYLGAGGETVEKVAKVPDFSCSATECHPQNDEFLDKKIKFTEKISYKHRTHFKEKIEGQSLHCDTCHQHVTPEKHFQVPKVICYLCHFKNTEFNKERSKCSLCHEIPTAPLQKQKKEGAGEEEKPITHQSLEEAKVACESCHYELVRGNGKIKQVACFECHDYTEEMVKKAEDKKLMHNEHVASQSAHCFECHEPISHREINFLDPVRLNCEGCHPDHHIYQKMLLVGEKRDGVPEMPALMFNVRTTCIGCHNEEKIIKGEKVAQGTGKSCAACHTEKHEEMANEWKDKTDKETKVAREVKQEALKAIEEAKGKVPQEIIDAAMEMIKQGQEGLSIVEYGGGVHNKKYSVMLIDAALNSFEDAIDSLEEEEEEVDVDCECVDGKLECADEDAEAEAEENECECDEEGDLVCA